MSEEGIQAWALIGHMLFKSRSLLNPVFCRHTHEGQFLGYIMVRRIVIKFGGALITKKDEECVANVEIIRKLCSVVHEITQRGIQVIVVHGAGSFGHLKAKRRSKGCIDILLPTAGLHASQNCKSSFLYLLQNSGSCNRHEKLQGYNGIFRCS